MQNGEQHLQLNGVRQWIRVAGGEHRTIPLVILHGGPGGNHFVFERTVGPRLAERRTVIYHEQRGCGRSDAPAQPDDYSIPLLVADLYALIERLGLSQVDLLGYSFGGGLALEYTRAHSERVRRLVLQAPVLRLHEPQIVASQLAGFRQVAQGELRARIENIPNSAARPEERLEMVWKLVDTETVDRLLFQNPTCAAFNRKLWQQSGLANTGDMHRALNAQPPTDTEDHLRDIQAPTLVLAGRHDRNVPLSLLQRRAQQLPQARLHIFEQSAHVPDIEETEAYSREVLRFLATPSPDAR